MRPLADLHVHTIASGHAYSTLAENVQAARARGLELIAVTDHGPSVPQGAHPWYFWNLKAVPSVIDGVQVLKGCEANPSLESENGVDLDDAVLKVLDFVAVGFHPLTGFDARDRDKNTEALVRVIGNPYVDMIAHPGNEHEFPVHIDTVVEAAVRHRVILEINDHSFAPSSSRAASSACERAFAMAAVDAGAPIAINSDAHHASRVGCFELACAVAEEVGVTPELLVNRDAASVLAFLMSRRERPRIDASGSWTTAGDAPCAPTPAIREET